MLCGTKGASEKYTPNLFKKLIKNSVFRYEDVDFGEEGYLEDLEPLAIQITRENDDGNTYFKIPASNNDSSNDARRLVEAGTARLGLEQFEDD